MKIQHKFLCLITALLFAHGLSAQQLQVTLGDSAFASVITCGPGNDFYTTFGHSALRICDSSLNLDVVYNYGVFDFNTPHFYWKFTCGNLNYCLARTSFANFMWEYAYEGRAVWEQRLRLTTQELNNLMVMLETNYLPQYRYYRYDLLRDNCATRVRDMVNGCLSHRTIFTPHQVPDACSYRDLLHQAMTPNLLWWQLGVDMLLGQRCDRPCDNMEYMFSPLEMKAQLDTTCIVGTQTRLAAPATQLLAETRTPLSRSVSPTLCLWLIAAAVVLLSWVGMRKGWRLTWFDIVLFVAAALASALMIFLWGASSHYCTKLNWNVLWASPLFLWFAIRPNSSPRWLLLTQSVLLFFVFVVSLFGIEFPQYFAPAVAPIALVLLTRLVCIILK